MAWGSSDKAQETLKYKFPSSKVSHAGERGHFLRLIQLRVHVCTSANPLGIGTSHVIAVSRLQWQHQARCVDVPGYLKPNPPACLFTATSLAALSCHTQIHDDIWNLLRIFISMLLGWQASN